MDFKYQVPNLIPWYWRTYLVTILRWNIWTLFFYFAYSEYVNNYCKSSGYSHWWPCSIIDDLHIIFTFNYYLIHIISYGVCGFGMSLFFVFCFLKLVSYTVIVGMLTLTVCSFVILEWPFIHWVLSCSLLKPFQVVEKAIISMLLCMQAFIMNLRYCSESVWLALRINSYIRVIWPLIMKIIVVLVTHASKSGNDRNPLR